MNGSAIFIVIVVLLLLFLGARCDIDHATSREAGPGQVEYER